MWTSEEIVHFMALTKKKRIRKYLCLAAQVERPIIPNVRLSLSKKTNADCILDFRFDRAGILKLYSLLRLPERVYTSEGDRSTTVETVCAVLFRMAYPMRYHDMKSTFGRSIGSLCRIFLHTVNLIWANWHTLILFCESLVEERMQLYCDAIHRKGSLFKSCFSFIDGTKLATCRIQGNNNMQQEIYTGHKRMHCLNYQGVVAPDGMCVHFFDPSEGRRHDITILRSSKPLEFLGDRRAYDGKFIYGDPAYGVSSHIISGFKGCNISEQQQRFNGMMSKVRESVGWIFGRMKTLWVFIDFRNQQKIMLSPVGNIVLMAMLLTNYHCCHNNGNKISDYFGLVPPSLEEYLSM